MRIAKLVAGFAFLFFTLGLSAQDASSQVRPLTDDDIALLRADLQADKTDIIGHTMQLTDAQAKVFWPLYREYANEQQKIGDQRVSLIKDYAKNYDTINDVKADEFMQRATKFDQDNYALRTRFYPQFKKAIGAKQAVKFFQIDNRLNLLLNVQLASLIPIVR